MTREEYNQIKTGTVYELKVVIEILKGERANYTGTEGATVVTKLCSAINQLLPDVIVNE